MAANANLTFGSFAECQMPLQDDLDAFKATWTERVGPDIAKMQPSIRTIVSVSIRKARSNLSPRSRVERHDVCRARVNNRLPQA